MAWLYSWPLQAELGLGIQGINHSSQGANLDLRGTSHGGSAGLLHQPHSMGCSHSLMFPGDFHCIINKMKIQAALI